MHIHILGICGTFMGSLAQLAVAAGHRVTGSDQNVYPPMSTQLQQAGIVLTEGFDPAQLEPAPDLIIIGNALSRGNPAVEAVLERRLPYTSGPQWLGEQILVGRHVLAVAGTHGKTTTASLLAWILEFAGRKPGYLIGGVPSNFTESARLGAGELFVVEADEYDSAFFDKRSKFVHYRATTAVLNNLEYDHADIFPDLAAIQRQFHHFIRTVPATGQVIYPPAIEPLNEVLTMGCWSQQITLGGCAGLADASGDWSVREASDDGTRFALCRGEQTALVEWALTGQHNVANALAAAAAAAQVGVELTVAAQALSAFAGVKRRMEVVAKTANITVYDDFAHHPTAIATTLQGLRAQVGHERILAVIEPRSATMRAGVHGARLGHSALAADDVFWFQNSGVDFDLAAAVQPDQPVYSDMAELTTAIAAWAEQGGHVVVMSNGGFAGLPASLADSLQ